MAAARPTRIDLERCVEVDIEELDRLTVDHHPGALAPVAGVAEQKAVEVLQRPATEQRGAREPLVRLEAAVGQQVPNALDQLGTQLGANFLERHHVRPLTLDQPDDASGARVGPEHVGGQHPQRGRPAPRTPSQRQSAPVQAEHAANRRQQRQPGERRPTASIPMSGKGASR